MIRRIQPGVTSGTVRAPPSKSYTHRALVSAFLGGHTVRVHRPLDSDDTRATAEGLRRLGAKVDCTSARWTVRRATHLPTRPVTIDCRESGTTLRLLTAVAALQERPVRFTGRGRLPERPMDSLITPLVSLGASVRVERSGRSLPFTIRGPIRSGTVSIAAKDSSQPVSALLLVCAALTGTSRLRCKGPVVSRPYIDATVAWVRSRGTRVTERGTTWVVQGPGEHAGNDVTVPGDASSAAYLWAAAVVSGGSVEVTGIGAKWPQADLRILDILRGMGANVRRHGASLRVGGRLRIGTNVDLTDAPDLYPLVGVLAAVTPGQRSILRGAPQLEHKESNRLLETLRLVRATGAQARRKGSSLQIEGAARARPLSIPDLTDHRLVMSSAVAALAAGAPSRIGDARAVRKSFPGFWSTLARMQRSKTRT